MLRPSRATAASATGGTRSGAADPTRIDRDWDHLHSEFRRRALATVNEVSEATGTVWVLVEGLRTQARQTWLYAQGRTRPGAVVTWKRTPTWHGAGLAGDFAPRGGYAHAPRAWWEQLRAAGARHGLSNPAWDAGDLGHLQLTDAALRVEAERWVTNGFAVAPTPSVATLGAASPPAWLRVFVAGREVVNADGHFSAPGRTLVRARPTLAALGWAVVDYAPGTCTVARDGDAPGVEGEVRALPCVALARNSATGEEHAYVYSSTLAATLGVTVELRDGALHFAGDEKNS